jgi:hypothetical protein
VVSVTRVRLLLIIIALVIGLTACGGGGGGDTTDGDIVDNVAPQFKGFALVVAGDADEVTAAWMPAVDNVTPADDIQYELYVDTSETFNPNSANLYATYTGETSGVIS